MRQWLLALKAADTGLLLQTVRFGSTYAYAACPQPRVHVRRAAERIHAPIWPQRIVPRMDEIGQHGRKILSPIPKFIHKQKAGAMVPMPVQNRWQNHKLCLADVQQTAQIAQKAATAVVCFLSGAGIVKRRPACRMVGLAGDVGRDRSAAAFVKKAVQKAVLKPHSGISVSQIKNALLFYSKQLQCAKAFPIPLCAGLPALPVSVCGKCDKNVISRADTGSDQKARSKYLIILMRRYDKDIHGSVRNKCC